MQWRVALKRDRVNGCSCGYVAPERLDTPFGGYRSLVVMQGIKSDVGTR